MPLWALIALLALPGCGGASTEAPPQPRSKAPAAPLSELRALGYAGWDDGTDGTRSGVAVVDGAAVPWARVWADDRSGVHAVLPDGSRLPSLEVPGHTQVEFARVLDGGRILCVSVDQGVTLLEPSGDVVFQLAAPAHHEAVVIPDGRPPGSRRFATLVHREVPHAGRNVRFDGILVVDERTGTASGPEWAFDTHDARAAIQAAIGKGPHPLDRPAPAHDRPAPERVQGTVYDYFHANGLAFDGPDRVVLCLRNVDALVTIDLAERRVLGAIGPGELDWPHAPTFVEGPGGERRLLVFDNGKHRGWSRVVELDPASGARLWEWRGTAERPLWSELRGYAQRLPGGNTLVTESERGRVLEIDRSGRVVWEFENPETRAARDGTVARRRIYRALATPELTRRDPAMRDASQAEAKPPDER